MSNNLLLIVPVVIAVILLVVKVTLFFRSTSRPSLSKFFYFNTDNIYNSENLQKEKAKLLQNQLSFYILILVVLCSLLFLITQK